MDNLIFGDVRIVLCEEDQERLRALAAHPIIHCKHVTLGSLPKREKPRLPRLAEIIGETVELRVVGMAQNLKVQAIQLELPDGTPCSNRYPHVTISCAEGAKPYLANRLLGQRSTRIEDIELTVIRGVVTLFPFA